MADLCALADGTLPAGRRAAVEARVAASPELRELLERQRRAVAGTRALLDEPVPASLRAAVEERLPASRTDGRRRGRPPWLVARLGTAVALAAALAIVAAVVLTGGPGTPTVAQAARFAGQPPSGPAPRPSGVEGTRLAVAVEGVVFPDLARAHGWRAVGVRRGEVAGRDATGVFYEKDGRRIAYVVVAGEGLPRPAAAETTTIRGVPFQTLHVDGNVVVTWRRLGHTCVLAGDAPRSELLGLASWRGDGTLRY